MEIFISLYLALSLGMGMFSITQMGYQHRYSIRKTLYKAPIAFIKGFLLWPYFLPKGLKNGKYMMKTVHKIGSRTNFKN